MKRIESQPAYILHTRNYRDTSLIVEFLTADYGRVSGVIKGVRSTAKSARQKRSLSQPFIPLLLSWSGNSDLKTIIHLESRAAALPLQGQRLFSGLYTNELLTRLLQPYDVNPELFTLYEWVLRSLTKAPLIDVVLRHFELQLLEYLGYGIDFTVDVGTLEAITADNVYQFDEGRGFTVEMDNSAANKVPLFSGEALLAIAQGNYTEVARRAAKQICRRALAVQLGPKPLKSRELFSSS